jgi:trans-aconitate 2-methyltransferase
MQTFYAQILIWMLALSSLFGVQTNDPWKGESYAKNSDSQKSSAEDYLSGLNLNGVSSVLDVGCGDGKITAAIAQALPGSVVIGVDISPSMIDFAHATFSSYPNLKFLVEDASAIDFHEKFDLIISFTVMQWVLAQAQALERFEKALKPGGRLCIQMPTGLPDAMEQALEKTTLAEKWGKYFTQFSPPWKFYQPEEYRSLLENAQFSLTRLETVTKHEKFPTRAAFQGFLKQWFPYLRPLPADLKDIFLDQLLDSYLNLLPPDEKGQVSFIVTRLEVEARKGS